MFEIPGSIDAVTPAWMTPVLHQSGVLGPNASVTEIVTNQIGQGVGIMGDIFRAALSYGGPASDVGPAPASVVVKLPSTFEANRAQGIALGMYEAEVRFYRELAPHTPNGLPVVFAAEIVSGTADFVIVMEDLGRLQLVDQSTGMTVAQAGGAVRVLADLHAAWWERVQTPTLEWVPSMVHARIQMLDGLLGQLWPVFVANFGSALPPGGAELGEAFSSRYLALQTEFVTRPWTLVHQDFRVENLMFGDPATDEIVVIDWQGLGRGPGAYDLAYVLGGSMPIAERRAHERELVAMYHQRLAERGVDYSSDRVWDDYCYAQGLGGLATSIVAGGTLDLSNERGRALVETMANRHFTAALDHDCMRLMR